MTPLRPRRAVPQPMARRRTLRRGGQHLWVLVLATLLSCGGGGGGPVATLPTGGTTSDVAAAQRWWTQVKDGRQVTYEVLVQCFCPQQPRWRVHEAADGSLQIDVLPGQEGEVSRLEPRTLDAILREARAAVDAGGEVTIDTDALGRVAVVALDPIPRAIDDEVTYRIEALTID